MEFGEEGFAGGELEGDGGFKDGAAEGVGTALVFEDLVFAGGGDGEGVAGGAQFGEPVVQLVLEFGVDRSITWKNKLGEYAYKPLLRCVVCMGSVWGIGFCLFREN